MSAVVERFTVSSRATGRRRTAVVFIYDTAEQMRTAATAFNGNPHSDSEAVTQAWDARPGHGDSLPAAMTLIRLHRGRINTEIVAHEVTHAAMAMYRVDQVLPFSRARVHFHNANEPFAYLLGELLARACNEIHRRGAWTVPTREATS